MDRSFLSNDALVNASRNFICIRTATYEDAEEAEFLRKIFSGRGGELENTVFALLAPDAQSTLSRTGRSPQFAYRSAQAMAAAMNDLALKFPGKPETPVTSLPVMKDVRLAVNVSACDGLPLVVVYGKDEEQLKELEKEILPLAFSPNLSGKFTYAKTTNPNDIDTIIGFDKDEYGFAVIIPSQYGISGKVRYQWPAAVEPAQLGSGLLALANGTSKVEKNHNQHVRGGMNQGILWKTAIPVEDKMSLRAMQGRQQRNRR